MTLLPILHEIDLRIDIDEALALRRAGRERRSQRSRKGWATRRDSDRHAQREDPKGLRPKAAKAARREASGIAQPIDFPRKSPGRIALW